jgi:hypothetical protein
MFRDIVPYNPTQFNRHIQKRIAYIFRLETMKQHSVLPIGSSWFIVWRILRPGLAAASAG